MFTKTFVRAFVLSAVLITAGMLFAASRVHKTVQEDDNVCSGSQESCEKQGARGEFMILEALNRAVMATAR